jgi:RHH-type proline utilization regulon transcriptional repressor/proline dehydrogenase/delta 1-pyrroline-5-carboxylate dehydrogenase
VAAIAPASSPLALPADMLGAALLAGNAVVLKPAPQAPACAAALVAALHGAGVPVTALHLLPGDDAAGAALAAHAGVDFVALAGTRGTGRAVAGAAAVAERRDPDAFALALGGVNPLVVDADADLDAAVPAILASAFGRAGQSCASASRLLVHEAVVDALRERLVGAIATLEVGPADAFSTDVSAVADGDAQASMGAAVHAGLATAVLAGAAVLIPGGGHYTVAALLCELPPSSSLLADEVPGPLLTLEPVASVAAACERLDGVPLPRTGALFSRSPATVAELARRAPARTLHVNRATVDAAAGSSGRADGLRSLLPLVEAHTTIEHTMRHGLVS